MFLQPILGFRLVDYKGGENPLLIYLFIACVCLALGASLWAYLKRVRLRGAFYRKCKKRNVPDDVIEVFVHFMALQKMLLSPEILTNRVQFDKFLNYVGFYFLKNSGKESLNQAELQMLINLRESLFPKHQESAVSTSRYFRPGLPIEVSFYDAETQKYVVFPSKVVDNKHYGLVIEVVDVTEAEAFPAHGAIRVFFDDPVSNMRLNFKSYVMRKDEDQGVWKIQHSVFVEKEISKKVEIPAVLYLRIDGKTVEHATNILLIKSRGCDIDTGSLPAAAIGILRFTALGEEHNFPVQVKNVKEQGADLEFTGLDEKLQAQVRKLLR